MLSLFLSAALLGGLTLIHPLPIACYGLAVIISFTGSTAIRDASGNAQLLTRVFAACAAICAILLASILAAIPIVADLAFVSVIFVAVYVRKFGVRWLAVGMIAFMSYFMGDYLHPATTDIGWIALAVLIAFTVTHLVTNFILRDDPEQDFRRALSTIDHRTSLILHYLHASAAGARPSGSNRKPLRTQMSHLRDIVLMAEGFIPHGEGGSLSPSGAASDLAVALFDLQLSIERLVQIGIQAPLPAGLLEAMLHRDDPAMEREWARLRNSPENEVLPARQLMRVHQARAQLGQALGPRPSQVFRPAEGKARPLQAESQQHASPAGASWVPHCLHAPIQVSLACAIALGCGLLFSPTRWYWAVITAFIVFNNTHSRADTARRALQRSGGTLAGLFAGSAMATLLNGHMAISIVLLLVLFFFAFYFVQASYQLMIFFITIALALLYGVMGMFTPELLVLRLEETIVGSLAGVMVAFLVFPVRASAEAAVALKEYLTALGDLVVAARSRAQGLGGRGDLLTLSRSLDRSYAELAGKVRPLIGPWAAVSRFGGVRENLLLLNGCAHWGRALARSLRVDRQLGAAAVERIDFIAREVTLQIAAVEKVKDSFFLRPQVKDWAASPATPLRQTSIADTEEPAFSLEVISYLLARAIPKTAAPAQ